MNRTDIYRGVKYLYHPIYGKCRVVKIISSLEIQLVTNSGVLILLNLDRLRSMSGYHNILSFTPWFDCQGNYTATFERPADTIPSVSEIDSMSVSDCGLEMCRFIETGVENLDEDTMYLGTNSFAIKHRTLIEGLMRLSRAYSVFIAKHPLNIGIGLRDKHVISIGSMEYSIDKLDSLCCLPNHSFVFETKDDADGFANSYSGLLDIVCNRL